MVAYGSLRIQAEHVNVNKAIDGEDDSYTGLRDAYSRLGVKLSKSFVPLKLSAKLEVPINLPQLQAEDPSFFGGYYKSNHSPRIANIKLSKDNLGSLTYGMQWLAYYNNIAYPVDYFSTFYSGFATHATFRREALTYTTPTFSGLKVTISGVDLTDNAGTSYLDSRQYALSYSANNLLLAFAHQDTYDDRADLSGFSASYIIGPWRFAAKYEQLKSNKNVKTNRDPAIVNFYTSYQMNQITFKALYSRGDGKAANNDEADAYFIGDSYHLGMDYQYQKHIKLFLEYFYEENAYAIYTPDSESFSPLAGYQNKSDGKVIAIGIRYDF
ncbi:MAG: porin [Gammaproteobacteria bacterium]|nr:porin [Gammaproteobacteria bacterium]